MGYYTWTFTDRKKVMGYGKLPKPVHILIPKEFGGGKITETYYEGYGEFDGHDIYDLVADWNKGSIMERFKDFSDHWLPCNGFEAVIKAFDKGGDKAAIKALKALPDVPNYMLEEWKRNIGITIACEDEDAKKVKYPIRITEYTSKKYEDFVGFSHNTQ